tara:strand:- start:4 stop:267 length:264 start_codon:yes stop_codon:yes gene_type:complete
MITSKIQEFIDVDINPALEMHNGYLRVLEYDEASKVLKVEMGGGCQGCASAAQTLKIGVMNMLKEEFPFLEDIQDITDHAAGEAPHH